MSHTLNPIQLAVIRPVDPTPITVEILFLKSSISRFDLELM